MFMLKEEPKEENNVYFTTDYEKFKFFPENREIKHFHVKRLKQSICEKNLLHRNPIIINKDFYIIDGQNRYWAARELNLPIYYRFEDFLKLEDVIKMNVATLKWGMEDYLHYHVQKGKIHYLRIQKLLETYKNINLNLLIRLLCKESQSQDKFKRGEFEFTKEHKNLEQVLEKIDMCIDLLEKKIVNEEDKKMIQTRTFVYALGIFFNCEAVDATQFFDRLNLKLESLRPCTQYSHYLELFLNIYNYGIKKYRLKRSDLFGE